MIKNILIFVLASTVLILGLQIQSIKRHHSDEIAQVIQNTSDATLAACEAKIEEVLAQF